MNDSFIHSEGLHGKTSTHQVLRVSSTGFKAKGNVPLLEQYFLERTTCEVLKLNYILSIMEIEKGESMINLTTVDIKSQKQESKNP